MAMMRRGGMALCGVFLRYVLTLALDLDIYNTVDRVAKDRYVIAIVSMCLGLDFWLRELLGGPRQTNRIDN